MNSKPVRFFIFIGLAVFFMGVIPASVSSSARLRIASALKMPIRFSADAGRLLYELFSFHDNAVKVRQYKRVLSERNLQDFQSTQLRLENERLTALMEIRPAIPNGLGKVIYCRVIARSSAVWNKVFLIDKGFNEQIRIGLPVFSGEYLVGKIAESGPSVSQVLLITDPSCKIAVTVQRTRQQGILYGASEGLCRVKYLSLEPELKPGDLIETSGLGMFFPKGIVIAQVLRAWKEPGQIYQVAEVRPLADLGRVEEVTVSDTTHSVEHL